MANKATLLKKRLIRDGVICIVIALALAGGAYEVSDYDDQTQSDKQHVESENNNLRGENDAKQSLLASGAEVSNFYENYIKDHNSNFVLNREDVARIIAALREKNHLVNLSVTVSPVTGVTDKAFSLKTGSMVQSTVKLTFSALTDNSVYNFIGEMERVLPGIVVINDLKINKERDLEPSILRNLSVHKLDSMVSVELDFLWLGLHPNDEKPANGTSAPRTQSGAR